MSVTIGSDKKESLIRIVQHFQESKREMNGKEMAQVVNDYDWLAGLIFKIDKDQPAPITKVTPRKKRDRNR